MLKSWCPTRPFCPDFSACPWATALRSSSGVLPIRESSETAWVWACICALGDPVVTALADFVTDIRMILEEFIRGLLHGRWPGVPGSIRYG